MFSLNGLDMKKALCAAAALLAMAASSANAAEDVTVPLHRSVLIHLPQNMSEVIVADPEIADIYPHGKNKLSIIGKRVGITTVRAFSEDNSLIRSIDVTVGYDLPMIRKTLKDLMPYESIGVEMVNTNLALTGQVSSTLAAAQAIKIVDQFVSMPAAGGGQSQTAAATGGNQTAAQKSAGEARSNILNLMEIVSGQQVMLRVRVGEIRRTALKNLGVNLQAVSNGADTVFSVATGSGITQGVSNLGKTITTGTSSTTSSLVQGIGSGTLANAPLVNNYSDLTRTTTSTLGGIQGTTSRLGGFSVNPDEAFGSIGGTFLNENGNGISGMLDALEQNGLFKVLAEPNLVALSGEEAKFLAGGEFPILVPQGGGAGGAAGAGAGAGAFVTVQFKPFGVSVKFKPTVLTESRIRMSVEPEVSELNPTASVVLNNISIPGLNTRRASTVIELSPGESFMIAGLISDNMRSTVSQVPGLGEIPILSALFRSTAFRREETELVLAVTPYLVDPMASGDVKLPTDNFAPASVMESFFYGALGTLNGDARRIGQTPQVEGPIGFMVD